MRPSAACVVLLAVLSPGAAWSQEQRGGVQVANLSFTGVQAVSESQLESALATKESAWLPWGTKHYFDRTHFEADLKRIEAFYLDRGFPNARVKSFDVDLSEDQNSVDIALHIDEGAPLRVERLEFQGFDPLSPETLQTLESTLPLQAGQPLDRALLRASRERALDELKEQGYPYASVRATEKPGSSPDSQTVMLSAEPGPQARFGPIEITGNTSVGDDVIRRQLWFRPGQPYQQSRLTDSQRRLYALEAFEFVNVEPRITEAQPEEIPIRVTVTEGDHRKVNFGLGYGSEEKARAEIDWRHVNFFGGARTAGVHARYSDLDRGVRLNLTQPYLITRRHTLGLTGQAWYTNEPAYWLDTLGGRATITRRIAWGRPINGVRPVTTVALTYANQWEEYEISNEALLDLSFRDELIALGLDPRTGRNRGQLSSVSLDGTRNTTGNLLDARRGYVLNVHLEKAGNWLLGDFNFYEVTLEGRFYQSIGNRVVVAVLARAGSIESSGPEEELVPFYKRYFLGGATNLRGWGRFEVSPLSGAGLPIGGHSVLNVSTEIRFPVWGNFGAVVFLDGGNVWTNPWDFNLNNMRYDAGPGIRYNTPIGPFRVDVGFQLNPIEGLLVNGEKQARPMRIHFSIGHAF